MKNLTQFLILTWTLCSTLHASWANGTERRVDSSRQITIGGTDIGGGGGGPVRYGTHLTWESAQMQISTAPLDEGSIPGLRILRDATDNLGLAEAQKGAIKKAYLQTHLRRYYEVAKDSLSEEMRSKLKAEYKAALAKDIPDEEIEIYAFTAFTLGETYLLPAFFELTPLRQAAILFHEALWMIKPELGYRFVIDAEIKFERYLRKAKSSSNKTHYAAYDNELFQVFNVLFDDPNLGIFAAARQDAEDGFSDMTMEEILGRDTIDYLYEAFRASSSTRWIFGYARQGQANYPIATENKRFLELFTAHLVQQAEKGRLVFTELLARADHIKPYFYCSPSTHAYGWEKYNGRTAAESFSKIKLSLRKPDPESNQTISVETRFKRFLDFGKDGGFRCFAGLQLSDCLETCMIGKKARYQCDLECR